MSGFSGTVSLLHKIVDILQLIVRHFGQHACRQDICFRAIICFYRKRSTVSDYTISFIIIDGGKDWIVIFW